MGSTAESSCSGAGLAIHAGAACTVTALQAAHPAVVLKAGTSMLIGIWVIGIRRLQLLSTVPAKVQLAHYSKRATHACACALQRVAVVVLWTVLESSSGRYGMLYCSQRSCYLQHSYSFGR